MNKRGQLGMMGVILSAFIILLVGIILFQATAQQVGTVVNTEAYTNVSLGAVAVAGTAQTITTHRALNDVVVFNATNGTVGFQDVIIAANNYTVANNVVTNGALSISITPAAGIDAEGYESGIWTVSGTAQPLTYISDSGGRAMANIITIFFALLIAIIAMGIIFNKELKDLIGL